MIELKNISFSYEKQSILDSFNLTINGGECFHLYGASGSGKTTVARIILGLEKAECGQIVVPQKISVVFQEDRLLDNIDVINNIRLVLSKDEYHKADNLLKEMGLWDVRKKRVSKLSGGMKRKVSIIRALAYNGDALILDEPFNGLDSKNKAVVAEIIKREYINRNKPVLLITHIKEDAELLGANIVNLTESQFKE